MSMTGHIPPRAMAWSRSVMARRRAWLCLPLWACLLVAACLLLPLRDVAASPVVHAARIGEHGQVTRFVLETDRPLDGHLFYLQNPDRIVLDLPETEWDLSAADGDAMGGFTGRGVIRAFRYGLFQPGTSRLVLDLARPATVARQFLLQPGGAMPHYRFVLDLEPADRTAFGRAANHQTAKLYDFSVERYQTPRRSFSRRATGHDLSCRLKVLYDHNI